ncbi:MAG TPA: tetratricopeptide repeat protein [Planctomycetota bacterium]
MAEPAEALVARGKAEVQAKSYEAAVATLTQALAERPGDVDALFFRGLALLRQGKYADGARDYAALLIRRPDHADGRFNLGWCYQKDNRLPEAEAEYGRYLELKPDDPDALLERARCRLARQDNAGAQADLDAADRLKPENADIRFQRGRARMGQGHWELAIKDFEASVGIDPEYTNAWYNRAWCRGKLGDHAGAAEDYTRYLGLYPDHADAYIYRGNRRFDLCDLRGTLADYEKAVSLDAANEKELRTWIDLARRLEKLERDGPNDQFVAACVERGNAKRDNGEHATALLWFARALEVDANAVDALHGRALTSILMGRHEDAIRDCGRAIEIKPGGVDYWHDRARSRRMSGDAKGALADFNRALEINPDYLYSLAGRAFTFTQLEDFASAVKDYERYVRLEPKAVSDIWYNLGWTRRKIGQHAEAVDALSKAIELNPADADGWSQRGYARRDAGDKDGARSDLRKAIALKPEYKETIETYIADMDRAPSEKPPAPAPARARPARAAAPTPAGGVGEKLKDLCLYILLPLGIFLGLGIARVPFLGDIPARVIDMPYKIGWIVAHWNDAAAFPPKSDLCMEPFCTRTDTSEKHVGGRLGYTSQVMYAYCPEHGPTFFSTGQRFDGFLYFIYWGTILVLSCLMAPIAALPLLPLIWLFHKSTAAARKEQLSLDKVGESVMIAGIAVVLLAWILFAWW